MAPTTFHLFPSLPPELRREIYKLATPIRIVEVQECAEEYEEFEERFAENWCLWKLDPSLTHFAPNWRSRIPFRNYQPTLEAYGYSAPPPSRPWTPSFLTPEIRLDWLKGHPEIAWELSKIGFLYSLAPIPALLHTCSESRSTLKSWGYRLAFRTRSNEPQTWFHFDRDVLYLRPKGTGYHEEFSSLFSGGPWDIGLFDPEELVKVRKLGLHRCRYHLPRTGFAHSYGDSGTIEVSNIIRMFGALKELLLPEWTTDDFEFEPELPVGEFYQAASEWSEPWLCIPIEEIDPLVSLFDPESVWGRYRYAGLETSARIKSHKEEYGPGANFYESLEHDIALQLGEDQRALLSDKRTGPNTSWNIPIIRQVHILPHSKIEMLSIARKRTVKMIRELKSGLVSNENQEMSIAMDIAAEEDEFALSLDEEEVFSQLLEEEGAIDQTEREEWELANLYDFDEEEAVIHSWDSCYCYCEEDLRYDSFLNEQKEWWVREGWLEVFDQPSYTLQ